MYTWVSLRQPTFSTFYTQFVLHNTSVFPKFVTIYIATCGSYMSIVTTTHVCPLSMWLMSLKPAYFSCRCQKKMFLEVWVVMQLTPSVVTILSSTLSLQNHINRGRGVHERGLEPLHCYDGGIGTLCTPTFSLVIISLCCRAWRFGSLEKRSSRTKSRFCEVPNFKRSICTSFHD